MGAISHIFGTLFRVIFQIIVVGLICGVIGAAVVLGAAFSQGGAHWPPSTLVEIAAILVGVLALYAGGVTVLMVEAVKAAIAAAKDVGKEAGTALKDGGSLLEIAEKEIGKHI